MNDDLNKKFKEIMDANPFDEIEVGLDSRYFDMTVGYDRQKGTKLSATIDLNSIGQMDPKQYEMEMARLRLEEKKIDLVNKKMAQEIPRPAVVKTTVTETQTTESTTEITQPVEDDYDYSTRLGAKAILDDDIDG